MPLRSELCRWARRSRIKRWVKKDRWTQPASVFMIYLLGFSRGHVSFFSISSLSPQDVFSCTLQLLFFFFFFSNQRWWGRCGKAGEFATVIWSTASLLLRKGTKRCIFLARRAPSTLREIPRSKFSGRSSVREHVTMITIQSVCFILIFGADGYAALMVSLYHLSR